MIIGVTISRTAYTPEAYAYEKYLINIGHSVQLDFAENLDINNDINIYFMGTRPFWQKKIGKAVEVHEYQSLSTGSNAKIKDKIKKWVNRKPAGRIFLNSDVKERFGFDDNVPYIYRDMGVDDIFFQKPNDNPEFDIVYCGSIVGRVGLVEILIKLSEKYKVIVVGEVEQETALLFRKANITLTGRLERSQIAEIYKNCRFGLNYTPDLYPFNIQTSTKTLEYLASELGVISNRYYWSEKFFKNIGYVPSWIDSNGNVDELNINVKKIDMKCYSWDNILYNSNYMGFLDECVK